jgi:hypothetical protein
MLRLGRVLRLVRLIRVIPALKSMVYLQLGSTNTASMWKGVYDLFDGISDPTW